MKYCLTPQAKKDLQTFFGFGLAFGFLGSAIIAFIFGLLSFGATLEILRDGYTSTFDLSDNLDFYIFTIGIMANIGGITYLALQLFNWLRTAFHKC